MTKIITTAETTILNAFFEFYNQSKGVDLKPSFNEFVNGNSNVITSDVIINIVCQTLNLEKEMVLSKRRLSPLVDARCFVAYYLRQSGETLRNIGEVLGGRDHSTILSLLDRFNEFNQFDRPWQKKQKLINQSLELYGIKI